MYKKPFLKWAGGKHRLIPFIQSNLPIGQYSRLVEPFMGSAALSLALDFDSYLLNDINKDLVNLFNILRCQKKDFIDYAYHFFDDKNNNENIFYKFRDEFNHTEDVIKKSALFLYLNRHAFNGLCRYNSKGEFNVPFGRYKKPYFPLKEMNNFIDKSDRIIFTNHSFVKVFDLIEENDIVYCDPPYIPVSKTSSFTSYTKESFSFNDQINLVKLAKIKSINCRNILISNNDTDFARKIYQDAIIKTVNVQRNISAKGGSRKKILELLAIY